MQAPTSNQVRKDLLLLGLLAFTLFFTALGARDLWNPNEAIYGRAVVEMQERADWLVPSVNGKVFAEKPILYFWSALAASKALGGVSELSLRLPSALAGTISIGFVYLLVLPYAGRRRALLTAAVFATMHLVVWTSRSVQMDVLVLVTTLGVVLPLSRRLDHGLSPSRAWLWAGIAAGFGFAAKGPVTWIVPALVIISYAALSSRLHIFRDRALLLAVAAAIGVGGIWYGILALNGESDFLYEVLVHQNFVRFTDAWNHLQPWWYYLPYVVTDYLPWSLLLPAAIGLRAKGEQDARLHRLGWSWLLSVLVFFSLSESKRSPYLLPVAPAIALLTSGVIEAHLCSRLGKSSRVWVLLPLGLLGSVFATAGLGGLALDLDIPVSLERAALAASGALALLGSFLVASLLLSRPASPAPFAVLGIGIIGVYLLAAIYVLPSLNPQKSARGFAAELNRAVSETGAELVSYDFWNWRAGYPYYAGRTIPNIEDETALQAYWQEHERALVLVEEPDHHVVEKLLSDAALLLDQEIGSRKARLYFKQGQSTTIAHLETGRPE